MLGDSVERALTLVGVTEERVSSWLGVPCKCPERKEKLNQLHSWARKVLKGRSKHPLDSLEEILEQPDE